MRHNEVPEIPLEITTERLIIRAPRQGDGAALFEAIKASMHELKPWMPWAHDGLTAETVEDEAKRAQTRFMAREDLRYHIFLGESDTLIGGTGLHRIDWQIPQFEIGYWIDSRHTGNGYAGEAAAGLENLAFNGLGARRVEIVCDSLNARSIAIPKRLGFQFSGEKPTMFIPEGSKESTRTLLLFFKER